MNWHLVTTVLAAFMVSPLAAIQKTKSEAMCSLWSEGNKVNGSIHFTQNDCGEMVQVRINVEGLTEGKHGFHVHEKGDIYKGCASTGGHFNPDKMDHGGPNADVRHVGDLGNIVADAKGSVQTTIMDHLISLHGPMSIVGRGLVIHENEDDLGLTKNPDSKKTGNAGGRVACCVIGVISTGDVLPCTNGSSTIGLSLSGIFFIIFSLLLKHF